MHLSEVSAKLWKLVNSGSSPARVIRVPVACSVTVRCSTNILIERDQCCWLAAPRGCVASRIVQSFVRWRRVWNASNRYVFLQCSVPKTAQDLGTSQSEGRSALRLDFLSFLCRLELVQANFNLFEDGVHSGQPIGFVSDTDPNLNSNPGLASPQ